MSEGLKAADFHPGDNGRSFVIETAAVCTAPHSYVCLLHPTLLYTSQWNSAMLYITCLLVCAQAGMIATSTDVPLGDGRTNAYAFGDALTAEYAKAIGAACSFDWLALSLIKYAQDANPIVRVWPIGSNIGLTWAQVTICFIYACILYMLVADDGVIRWWYLTK